MFFERSNFETRSNFVTPNAREIETRFKFGTRSKFETVL